MVYQKLPDKVKEKWNLELLELHKRCCKTYLVQKGIRYTAQHKFFRLYDLYIRAGNIRDWFNLPIWLCVQTLVKGDFEKVFHYRIPENYVQKRRKKSVRRKK